MFARRTFRPPPHINPRPEVTVVDTAPVSDPNLTPNHDPNTLVLWRGVVVSGVRRMNEVNARRARLVPGWVTVFGRVYHLGM